MMTFQEIEKLRQNHWRPLNDPGRLFMHPPIIEKTWWNTTLPMILKIQPSLQRDGFNRLIQHNVIYPT